MHFPAVRLVSTDTGPLQPLASSLPPLFVFSPLRWHFDLQRPQQLLTRLAKHYRVFYVEEPVTTHEDAYLASSCPAPGVEVLVPHTRIDVRGFDASQMPVLRTLLADFMRERDLSEPLAWLFTATALPLLEELSPCGVIVDEMDGAPVSAAASPQAREREAQLLQAADLVLAGGPSLYRARRARHANVHCIANAVDAAHFAPVATSGSSIAAISARSLHAPIPGPRLGYFGLIDERLDLDMIARIADARPDWQLMMAGPVVRVDPATLPTRPNIHWLGAQTYAILPHLMAHWDLCILPFKVDEASRQASPHQVLEYLAGQKSVVSTPVHDVVALHGHIVRLAPDANSFVEACRAALCERGPTRRQRRIDALIAVHSCTWSRAAERVHQLLAELVPAGAPVEVPLALVAHGRAGALRYAMG